MKKIFILISIFLTVFVTSCSTQASELPSVEITKNSVQVEEVKAIANDITKTNNEDGVAYYLEKNFLQ